MRIFEWGWSIDRFPDPLPQEVRCRALYGANNCSNCSIIVQTRKQKLFEISPMLQFQCTLYQSSSMFALAPPLPNLYRTTLCLPFHAGTGTKLAGNWRQINNYWSWHQVGKFIVEAGIKLTAEEALHLLVQEPLQLLFDGSLLEYHWFKLLKLNLH